MSIEPSNPIRRLDVVATWIAVAYGRHGRHRDRRRSVHHQCLQRRPEQRARPGRSVSLIRRR